MFEVKLQRGKGPSCVGLERGHSQQKGSKFKGPESAARLRVLPERTGGQYVCLLICRGREEGEAEG